jgi:hypothetical protein
MAIDLRSDGRATSATIEISAATTRTTETSIFLLFLLDPPEKCSGSDPASGAGEEWAIPVGSEAFLDHFV